MSVLSGYNGCVQLDSNAVIVVKKFDIDDTADLVDTTGMVCSAPSRRKTYAVALTDWSGTFDGQMDSTETQFAGSPPAISAGASGTGSFTVADSVTYTGPIIFKSVKISSSVEGVVEFSVSFQGNGDLTYPT